MDVFNINLHIWLPVTLYTVSEEKLDTFSFEHNFGKYCSILIINSLLQTELTMPKCTIPPYLKSASALPCKMNKNGPTLLARFRNYRRNSQTRYIECSNNTSITCGSKQLLLAHKLSSCQAHTSNIITDSFVSSTIDMI